MGDKIIEFPLTRRQFFRAGIVAALGTFVVKEGIKPVHDILYPYPKPKIIADCSKHPADVRVFVDAIMNRANWILERIPAGQPLVIIIGENHKVPADTAVEKILLGRLKQQHKENPKRTFAFGVELQNSFHKEYATKDKLINPAFIKAMTKDGFIVGENDSPLTRAELFRFCAEEKIPVSFGDVAHTAISKDNAVIDQSDPFTRDIVASHAPEMLDKEILRGNTALGIKLSNLAMFEEHSRHGLEHRPKIFIVECGLAHVLGQENFNSSSPKYAYQDSLAYLFKQAGAAVLLALPTNLDFPYESEAAMENAVGQTGMERASLRGKDATTARFLEKNIMRRINDATGGEFLNRHPQF